MGLLKKIFKPVSKVLDKIIPNEIKPALPYLAAFAPMFGPAQGLMGQGMLRRALISGGLNIGAQLAQEGNEGEVNLLSAGLGALTGAMTAPGAADAFTGATTKGTLADQGIIGSQARMEMANRGLLTQAKDFGLESLAKGSEMFAAGMEKPFSMAGAKAAALPAATATGDLMQAEARRLEKQAAIDDALAQAELLADSGARAEAIRNAMLSYGFFTNDEIEDTIASAGYKAGGRVGYRFGGMDAAIDKVEDESIKESMKFASDIGDMDIPMVDLVEQFEIIFKRKPSSLDELKQFYRDFYEYKGPGENIKMKEKIKEKVVMEAKDGGLMNLGGKEMDLRGGGFVPIGKKERADDVPARLSKNEFVMTADAVRAAGGGSVNKGAKRMYELMNNLEARV
jgi:hypothetical protein